MLNTYFYVRGTLYKSNKIPSSYDELKTGASKILNLLKDGDSACENTDVMNFYFTYTTPTQIAEAAIKNDEDLMQALT